MKISKIPENYSGARAGAVYEIAECNPAQVTQVEIFCTGEGRQTIAIKRFGGEAEYDVNISNYLRRMLAPEPLYGENCAFGHGAGRSVEAIIKAGGVSSPSRIMTAGSVSARELEAMSNAPQGMRISPAETDEISFVAPGRSVAATATVFSKEGARSMRIAMATAGQGVCTLVVSMSDIANRFAIADWDGVWQVRIDVEAGGKAVAARLYDIVPADPGAVRLCWLNPYGAIDYNTFAGAPERVLSVAKSKTCSPEGYSVCGAEVVTTLRSEYEPRKTIEWLAEIVAAPAVWIADGGEFAPVDVVTESVDIASEAVANMTVKVREKKKNVF